MFFGTNATRKMCGPYGFGEVRVAEVALLIFTVLSGWCSCGVVITKFSDHVVTFRSSPTVFADTPVPTSASTRILAGKPLRAMSSAAMFLHLYRGIGSSLIVLPPPNRQAVCPPTRLDRRFALQHKAIKI